MSFINNPVFVFIHGAWHDKYTWSKVISHLTNAGYASIAHSLPGAGENSKAPTSYFSNPFDDAKFTTEASPNAGVTQESRDAATVHAITTAKKQGNGKVILVGHSLGGLTVSSVSEQHKSVVDAVVYVAAFLLPKGMPAVAMILSDIMSEALVPSLFCADPEQVGALRLNPKSTDIDYMYRLKSAFYGDLSQAEFEIACQHLHCDEPVQVAANPSSISTENFGSIPRVYVHCTNDNAIPIAAQKHMVEITDLKLGNKAVTYTLESSHSPFLSRPNELSQILINTAKAL